MGALSRERAQLGCLRRIGARHEHSITFGRGAVISVQAPMNLAPNIYLAPVGDRAIVLDLVRHKYLGLNSTLAAAARLALSEPVAHDQSPTLAYAQNLLVARGILIADEAPARRETPGLAEETIWPSSAANASLNVRADLAISALRSLVDVQRSLRRREFSQTLEWLEREKSRGSKRRAQATASVLVDAYYNVRPWFPVDPICRLDAAAICLLFWRNGHSADLVFGARLDPFVAHCWAQWGRKCLSEAHDRVRQYSTLFAI